MQVSKDEFNQHIESCQIRKRNIKYNENIHHVCVKLAGTQLCHFESEISAIKSKITKTW